jgi:hypothetical protein
MDVYCTSCHLLPNPKDLDKATWKSYILPRMGYMLGFRKQSDSTLMAFADFGEGVNISGKSANLRTKSPVIGPKDWQRLQDYIVGLAPEKLTERLPRIDRNIDLFKIQKVEMPFIRPATTLTAFVSPGHIISADANRGGILMHYNKDMEMYRYDSLGINIVHLQKQDNVYWLTHMGLTFDATDDPNGYISCYSEGELPIKIIENLTRPVHVAYGDLSGNGGMELVVSEFGKWTGKLSWWKKIDKNYERTNLIDRPGAIKSEIIDMDADGKNDVVSLFAQGDEAVYISYNQGDGVFLTKKVLNFPPTYGSTYFTIIDYNNDGYGDIIHTSGDNGDYPSIPKPYHGIRIFLNDGHNCFEEKIFIPLQGVYKVILNDFDLDGDLDFAAISYFPNFKNEYFVFLENDGSGSFTRKGIMDENLGQWLTMDAFDYDSDGDVDLVLGSYDWGQNSNNSGYIVPIIYLKNRLLEEGANGNTPP